jgi:hypothetical protein
LFGQRVKVFPFVLSLSKDERESRVGVASYRRSCFDKLSTNGLSGKQDFWTGFLFTFV